MRNETAAPTSPLRPPLPGSGAGGQGTDRQGQVSASDREVRMANPGAPEQSPSSMLAIEDTKFLLRDEMRPIRFALEFGKAELLLRDWGIRSTIIVFGGSRIPS
jgi:hypothetical protein